MRLATARLWSRSAGGCAGSLALVAVLAGCAGTDMVGPGNAGSNIPAVGMNDGQFGFAVAARDWTSDQDYAPALVGGTLQIGLVIAGYTSGAGELTVTDSSGTSVFSQSLAGNVAEGSNAVAYGTPPFHVRVATTRYTGMISVGISAAVPPAARYR